MKFNIRMLITFIVLDLYNKSFKWYLTKYNSNNNFVSDPIVHNLFNTESKVVYMYKQLILIIFITLHIQSL